MAAPIGTADHGVGVDQGHRCPDHGEEPDQLPAPGRRLHEEDCQRSQHRQHHEGEGHVQPQREVPDRGSHLAPLAPPYESLAELMGAEDEGQGGNEKFLAAVHVAQGLDADGAHDHAGGQVGFRGKAHCRLPEPTAQWRKRHSDAPC